MTTATTGPAAMMDAVAHSSQSLIGRDAELESLISLLGVASVSAGPAGRPEPGRRHLLLAGDAGVGKTRLLTELSDRAVTEGWQVYAGRCLDFGDSAESYLPFAEILGRVTATLPDIVAEVAGLHPALLRMAAVGRALGDRGVPETEAPDRGSLFAGVHALLDAVSEKAPTLVVVEDVHWADQSTRDLLTFLFTRPFLGPVAIVASYRSDDLHRRHPLRRQAAEWTRLPAVERETLGPLRRRSALRLARTLDPGLTDDQASEIVERADGNAFFVEELVEAAGAHGGGIPDDLADVLLVRLDRLGGDARQVVRTASAAGRDVSDELLAEVAELDRPALEAAVREAIEMGVLVARNDGYYVFRHALLGEAVYDELLPGERVRLHQRYVEVLRGGLPTGTAAGLARHARLGGDRATALEAGIRAGDDAAAAGGPAEAAQHYEQALAILAERGGPVDAELIGLVERTAEALIAAGQALRALSLIREHLGRLPADAPGLWRAQLRCSEVLAKFAYVTGDDLLPLTTEAVEALPDDAPDLVRARVFGTHARVLSMSHRRDESGRFGREALALAEGLGRKGLAAEISVTLARPHGPCVDPYLPRLRAAIERAHDAGAVFAELRGRMMLGLTLTQIGDLDGAVEVFSVAHELGQALGLTWAPYAFDARIHLMRLHCAQGRVEEALALADVHDPPPVLGAWLTSLRLVIEQARGADVTDELARIRPYWPQEVAIVLEAGPVEMLEAGRRSEMEALLAAYADATAVLKRAFGEPLEAGARLAAIAIEQLCAILPTLPLSARASVIDHVERLFVEGSAAEQAVRYAWGPEGRAWSVRLRADALRARWLAGVDTPPVEDLVAAWRSAEEAFEAYGHVYELLCVRVTLAGVLRATGDLAAARLVADAARQTAAAIGAQPLLDALRAQGMTPAAAPTPSDRLTQRELEIIALVAEGLSNGEIGKRLFISTKTASVHVSNILGKLGAAGRTEAAAIARRRGLLG